jgi:hypothetical protein
VKYILFLLLMIGLNAAAQTGRPVTKIIIKYFKGYNPFQQSGIYSKGEVFEISANDNTTFKISHYLKITSTQIDSNNTKTDTVQIRLHNSLISKTVVDSLYRQLNTTKDNFNISFIKPQLRKPKKEHILEISKRRDDHWKFEKEYTDESNNLIKKIQNFDKLDSFINLNKPKPEVDVIIVDVWDKLTISYVFKNDTMRYVSEFHQLLGQPFSRPPGLKIDLKENKITIYNTANLEINTVLSSILPRSSILRKRLDINSLTDEYIAWYIDKVL